jgi:hypothetical protein
MNYWNIQQAREDKRRRGQERLVWLVVGLMWVCVAVGIVVTG